MPKNNLPGRLKEKIDNVKNNSDLSENYKKGYMDGALEAFDLVLKSIEDINRRCRREF